MLSEFFWRERVLQYTTHLWTNDSLDPSLTQPRVCRVQKAKQRQDM